MLQNSNDTENNRLWGYLTLLLPVSFGIVITLESWRFFLALAALSGMGFAWRWYRRHQKNKLAHLDAVFYRLIRENQGRITALDLAMNAKLPGGEVQQYLDGRAKEFVAEFEVTEQGGIVYCFQSALPVNSSEVPLTEVKRQAEERRSSPQLFPVATQAEIRPVKLSYTQAELAKRFKVHPTTLSKWKVKSEFSEWSRQKDPEAVAWDYSVETKKFYPKP